MSLLGKLYHHDIYSYLSRLLAHYRHLHETHDQLPIHKLWAGAKDWSHVLMRLFVGLDRRASTRIE